MTVTDAAADATPEGVGDPILDLLNGFMANQASHFKTTYFRRRIGFDLSRGAISISMVINIQGIIA